MAIDDKASRRAAALAMLVVLQERHPLAFARHRPALAVGIRDAIVATNSDLDPDAIGAALQMHCSTELYLRSSAYGPHRVNLDGEPVEPITEQSRTYAGHRLTALLKRRAKNPPLRQRTEAPAATAVDVQPDNAPQRPAGANGGKPILSLKIRPGAA